METVKSIYLSTAYFGPVSYYNKLIQGLPVLIENKENYSKKSYRNRCEIYNSNGKLSLSVPVIASETIKTPITEVRIDYREDWQKNHLKALESAYRSSPFFEYYIPYLEHFFNDKTEYLYDLNMSILNTMLEILEINSDISETNIFEKEYTNSFDYRFTIHPKKQENLDDKFFESKDYYQVFSEKHNFIPNLSILDLLFNEGPNTEFYL